MKIGFDAKRAAQNRTGLGNYSRFVLRILSQHEPQNEYHLYIPNERRTPFLGEIPTVERLYRHYPRTWFWRKLKSLWRVWGVPSDVCRDGMDIYHGLSNELPLNVRRAGCKTVVTIHDLIFLRYPQYYHPIDRTIYNHKFRRACENADRVIAVSEFTKQDIIKFYGTPADKIDVVYQGCDPVFGREIPEKTREEVRRRYGLPQRFLLYVGSIEERKNLMLVARALDLMRRRHPEETDDISIVAVQRRTDYTDTIRDYLKNHRLADRFLFFHGVTFADLPSFYRLATAFVYPSRIEGFGIPMLEAISAGLPAIGCTGSCLEEAGGPDSAYVSPDDPEEMAETIRRVWTDQEVRRRMTERGREYAHRFSDENLCRDLMAVYGKVMEG